MSVGNAEVVDGQEIVRSDHARSDQPLSHGGRTGTVSAVGCRWPDDGRDCP
jgi:hypothetical protein